LHIFLNHFLGWFIPRRSFGDVTEECFEQKHKASKAAAHRQRMNLKFALMDLATVDLLNINERSGEDPIFTKVVRNQKALFHPKALAQRRAELSAAKASIAVLKLCREEASAVRSGAGESEGEGCPRGVGAALANVYIEPPLPLTLPLPHVKVPDPNSWVSPFFLQKQVVAPKEASQAAPNEVGADLNEDDYGVVITEREDDDDEAVSDASRDDDDVDEIGVGDGVDGNSDFDGDLDEAAVAEFETSASLEVRGDILAEENEVEAAMRIDELVGSGPDEAQSVAASMVRTEVRRRVRVPNQRLNDYVT